MSQTQGMGGCCFRWRRAVALLLIIAGAWLVWFLMAPAKPPRVVVVSNNFVLPAKFEVVKAAAQQAGVECVFVNVDQATPPVMAQAFEGARLVLFDTPREDDMTQVREKTEAWLARQAFPWVQISARGHETGNLDADLAEKIYRYYRNGGQRNFERLFVFLQTEMFGVAGLPVLPVIEFPDHGFYHPDLPEQVVTDFRAYEKWLSEREGLSKNTIPVQRQSVAPSSQGKDTSPPVIGIIINQAVIRNVGAAHVDSLIHKIESAGATALAYYYPMTSGPGALDALQVDGRTVVDVLINLQMMYQGNIQEDYVKLDVPVLQGLVWRSGDHQDWQKSVTGLPMGSVPFYLAIPEQAGLIDPLMLAAVEAGDVRLIDDQADAMVMKALRMARLRHVPHTEKRVAVMFYNYPDGEKNLAASFMNVPRSLVHLSEHLCAAGYAVDLLDEATMIERTTALMAPFYRPQAIEALAETSLAGSVSLADYLQWFDSLPSAVRERVTVRWGAPDEDPMLVGAGEQRRFVIPRMQVGNLVIMPQPPRGRIGEPAEKSIYHDTRVPLTHFYMASYLYVRQVFDADALIHFGTHGSQEWTPGKERGLSVHDDPYLVLGDLPVVYPYIVDNIGEATQAKRRGRAMIVSHQTPSFAPAGLHQQLVRLHDLIHEYGLLDEGEVRRQTEAAIIEEADRQNMVEDIGWDTLRARQDFFTFQQVLHDYLHQLAQTAQPLGLHTLGVAPEAGHRLSTVMQMLGEPFYQALNEDDPQERFVEDYTRLQQSLPYQILHRHLVEGLPVTTEPYAPFIPQARVWYAALSASGEDAGLLAALDGHYLRTQYGGDPIRHPESLPTGRNLYGFDPSKLPTEAAWKAGGEAFQNLLTIYLAEHGKPMQKLAVSLWSVEAMRHLGVLEAQVFHALGVQPVWDRSGRITDIQIIPRTALGRPRVDVVVSATGLYRDHFPTVMALIARAVKEVAELDEPDNAVRNNTLAIEARLLAQGIAPEEARDYALTRIFSSQSGMYGSGLDAATQATDTWEQESRLAELYLARMQYAYGPDTARWGKKPEALNLYAEQLQGVEAAVLSRSSSLYGMLTTDDPFQYLGGLSLAVRHLSGSSPSLYISNLRDPSKSTVEPAGRFLAAELRSRYFHPQWIESMKREGHAGTLNVVDTINNFWGWQATAPEIVRDDQWQQFFEVYVQDSLNLEVREWFEQHNPTALAQIVERMLEANRKGYWQADSETLRTLVETYREMADRHDYQPNSSLLEPYVQQLAVGFGLHASAESAEGAAAVQVTGQRLEHLPEAAGPDVLPWTDLMLVFLMLIALFGGAWHQSRKKMWPDHLLPAQPPFSILSSHHNRGESV